AARDEMAEGLIATLNSNVEALKIWFETEQAEVLAAAGEVEVRRVAGELTRLAANQADPSNLAQSPLQEGFRAALRPLLSRKHFSGYVLVNKDRLIVAADRAELIGLERTTNYDLVTRTLDRGATVTPPFPT